MENDADYTSKDWISRILGCVVQILTNTLFRNIKSWLSSKHLDSEDNKNFNNLYNLSQNYGN